MTTGWGNARAPRRGPCRPLAPHRQSAPPALPLRAHLPPDQDRTASKPASIPTPAHLERFRVGSVNRLDFYEWAQPGVLSIERPRRPPRNRHRYRGPVPTPRLRSGNSRSPSDPPTPSVDTWKPPRRLLPSLTRLARSWTQGIPRGWQQVEAVVKALRGHCEHDPSATPPQNCPDLMAHFLVDARRGPDYLFATAAALMLRSLNYPTRVVGGFYVDPDRYDPIARHVAVIQTENAHLWVEVQLPGGEWVTIEPTPGFELMPPLYSLARSARRERLAAASVGRRRNAATLALARRRAASSSIDVAQRPRSRLHARLVARDCHAPRASRVVLATLRLIERRASWAGRGADSGADPHTWCGIVVGLRAPSNLRADLRLLVRLAQQWTPTHPGRCPSPSTACALCRRVVKSWTLSTFRTIHWPQACSPEPRSHERPRSLDHPDADRLAVETHPTDPQHRLRGKAEVVEHVLACLLARGHLLIEDLPGLGKTTLAKALARVLGGKFARVQCTPDLLPGDVTGFRVFDQKTREFEFLPGPVFADVLLADEINRSDAPNPEHLLEAMAERQVTVDSLRHVLSDTFFVIATQNPVEQHGTYPLPEAQLDRFAMKLRIGYPGRSTNSPCSPPPSALRRSPPRPRTPHRPRPPPGLQEHVAAVAVSPIVAEYLVDLAAATRAAPPGHSRPQPSRPPHLAAARPGPRLP